MDRPNTSWITGVASILLVACDSCSSSGPASAPGQGPGPFPALDASASVADASRAAVGCQGVTCKKDHQICDPLDGKCKLDGTTTAVGGPCTISGTDPKCGADPNATCNDSTTDEFPLGYCSLEPCSATNLCPIGSVCGRLNAESPACWKRCEADADCRDPDYSCVDIDTLWVSGPARKVCFFDTFSCDTNADCPSTAPTCVGSTMTTVGECQ